MTKWLKFLHLLGKHSRHRCWHESLGGPAHDGVVTEIVRTWHCSLCEPDKGHTTEQIAEGKTMVINGRLVRVEPYRPKICQLPKDDWSEPPSRPSPDRPSETG